MHVLMVAAENDALPNAKVGGVADVLRDCPKALVEQGLTVDVVIPDYGFSALERIQLGTVEVPFAGSIHSVQVWQVYVGQQQVRQIVLSHSLFSQHNGDVYCNDDGDRPFATDATKFALFNASVCEALLQGVITRPDVLHLHDWHSACVAVLLKFDQRFASFSSLRTVYTVHNIALQGIRPFKGDDSSLEAWFPSLSYNGELLCDPRYPHCFNPMRSAINLVDKIHLVSPSYAQEVLQASQPHNGYFGGEGLEQDLKQASAKNKLVGILNGCEYNTDKQLASSQLSDLYAAIDQALFAWMAKEVNLQSSYYIAHQRLLKFSTQPMSGPLVTSVGRLTDQKALLLRQPYQNQQVLDQLCQKLAEQQGRMIILGSGDPLLENTFTAAMARNSNLLFLKGYGNNVGDLLYELGDLFLMPSSFEPCGISQMLAMRAGQPCLVHQVGGLKDTIADLENGFSFSGDTLQMQSEALLNCFEKALTLRQEQPNQWQQIVSNAKAARFTWSQVATDYLSKLYN
ncbi:glycogen/starch synthase [Pseudoalteromonas sp. KG3]|uniref:starch synthase n=1 Tax=Pseudoalteromonas prydzensis TaxID=182141 RepID=A0ABR9FM49_9GAMM|nr:MULTISPECIES: glycogen/starch synthase [Pseudoalteromonas]MBE0457913.1 glycogen/starch synthase [Pseudoalteromonas prydzensis]WKD26168.1 glycogen/starch synthase [Pseudoalteromonas sp. KG3]